MKRKFLVVVNNKEYIVEIEEIAEEKNEKPEVQKSLRQEGLEKVIAPMSGKVILIKVREGDIVKEGDILLIIEAMKMENEIRATRNGKIKEIKVKEGDKVEYGEILLVIE